MKQLMIQMIFFMEITVKFFLTVFHIAGKGMSLENAAKWTPIPLHPGAERFYKEAGVLK